MAPHHPRDIPWMSMHMSEKSSHELDLFSVHFPLVNWIREIQNYIFQENQTKDMTLSHI